MGIISIGKLRSAIDNAAARKMLSSYFMSAPELEAKPMKSTKTNPESRKKAIDLRLKDRDTTNDIERNTCKNLKTLKHS